MHRRVVAVVVAAALSGMVLAGCGSDDNGGTIAEGPDPSAKMVQVNAINTSFTPTDIELTAGEDVQFVITNGDQIEHNLTVEGLGVNQDAEGGKTENAPVTKSLKAGTYKFHCEYHPQQMQGTVTVT